MNNFTLKLATAALLLGSAGASYALTPKSYDPAKHIYKGKQHSGVVFDAKRMSQVNAANAILEAGKPSRFANALTDNGDNNIHHNQEFADELHGDLDGPDGRMWFYSGKIEYKVEVYEYFTEYLPESFSVTIYTPEMEPVASVKDKFVLKEDEARVRQVEVLPILTRNYFNTDDNYELAISVLVNPLPYGIRPYTYVYSLGGEKDAEGDDVPVTVLNSLIADVCDASNENGENIFMTFQHEGNDSNITEEDLMNGGDDAYWAYQLGNYVRTEMYGKADANGNLQKVFEKRITYYQAQGNQQDDPPLMTYVHNGKPTFVYAYYEDLFYNQFGMTGDMSQRLPNNLVLEIYELDDINSGYHLVQTTKIPMSKAEDEDVIASYYGVGAFDYKNDIMYGADDRASFIITRRDYVASSDSERLSYFIYGPDGDLKQALFENTMSHVRLADIEGCDPQELFINLDGQGYWFNFVNMRTFATELSMFYGLQTEDSDEPDYMMANLERTKVGDSFMYVVEMRTPEYDDINDLNYLRIAWITPEGQVDHMDYVNMGNKVNYATLNLMSYTLDENYFHISPEHEYMLLIKRAVGEGSSATEEQLLVSQAISDEHPLGVELMFLGPDSELGALKNIIPYYDPDRLGVTYSRSENGREYYTTRYFDLPFNKSEAGVNDIVSSDVPFVFDGTTVSYTGEFIEVYNLQGILVASAADAVSLDGMTPGIYMVRAAGHTGKVVVR